LDKNPIYLNRKSTSFGVDFFIFAKDLLPTYNIIRCRYRPKNIKQNEKI